MKPKSKPAARPQKQSSAGKSNEVPTEAASRSANEISWKDRLVVRRYRFPLSGEKKNDLSACIEHAGVSFWFPLGTSDLKLAAVKAREINDFVVQSGWDEASRQFSRELMVGFEWCSNPILWTYTTLHTLVQPRAASKKENRAQAQRVLIVEPDAGIRQALQCCIDQQPGFSSVPCDSAEAFPAEFALHKPQLILVNRHLAKLIGCDSPGRLAPIQPDVPALTYSVVTTGDELFVSTPGGAAGYFLKRVDPLRILEPILNRSGQTDLAGGDLLSLVKSYFNEMLSPARHPENSGVARLTPREHEVLALLSKGLVDKEIAQAMGISTWTVHDHMKSIFDRLQVRTRTEAVVRYLEK